MVTGREVAFLIDYNNSTPKKAAETTCEKEAKDDAKAYGACLEKQRDQFKADVLRFEKDDKGRASLTIYKRSGAALTEISVSSIEFSDETDTTVNVKMTGRSKGVRPLFKSGAGTLLVPNDYTVEMEDKDLGKLSYTAKIGLIAK